MCECVTLCLIFSTRWLPIMLYVWMCDSVSNILHQMTPYHVVCVDVWLCVSYSPPEDSLSCGICECVTLCLIFSTRWLPLLWYVRMCDSVPHILHQMTPSLVVCVDVWLCASYSPPDDSLSCGMCGCVTLCLIFSTWWLPLLWYVWMYDSVSHILHLMTPSLVVCVDVWLCVSYSPPDDSLSCGMCGCMTLCLIFSTWWLPLLWYVWMCESMSHILHQVTPSLVVYVDVWLCASYSPPDDSLSCGMWGCVTLCLIFSTRWLPLLWYVRMCDSVSHILHQMTPSLVVCVNVWVYVSYSPPGDSLSCGICGCVTLCLIFSTRWLPLLWYVLMCESMSHILHQVTPSLVVCEDVWLCVSYSPPDDSLSYGMCGCVTLCLIFSTRWLPLLWYMWMCDSVPHILHQMTPSLVVCVDVWLCASYSPPDDSFSCGMCGYVPLCPIFSTRWLPIMLYVWMCDSVSHILHLMTPSLLVCVDVWLCASYSPPDDSLSCGMCGCVTLCLIFSTWWLPLLWYVWICASVSHILYQMTPYHVVCVDVWLCVSYSPPDDSLSFGMCGCVTLCLIFPTRWLPLLWYVWMCDSVSHILHLMTPSLLVCLDVWLCVSYSPPDDSLSCGMCDSLSHIPHQMTPSLVVCVDVWLCASYSPPDDSLSCGMCGCVTLCLIFPTRWLPLLWCVWMCHSVPHILHLMTPSLVVCVDVWLCASYSPPDASLSCGMCECVTLCLIFSTWWLPLLWYVWMCDSVSHILHLITPSLVVCVDVWLCASYSLPDDSLSCGICECVTLCLISHVLHQMTPSLRILLVKALFKSAVRPDTSGGYQAGPHFPSGRNKCITCS